MVAVPEASRCEPTASQKAAETHDTAVRPLSPAPGGATPGWICHELPVQDSARARRLPVLNSKSPPASHAAAVAQDTVLRTVNVAPAGLGAVCAVQEVPFHVSLRLKVLPELSL